MITDPAFGCGKTYEVTYTCDSGWGWTFIIALCAVSGLYVGGGSAYNVKMKGAAPGIGMVPQLEQWREGYGLVVDGARFTKARVDALRGGAGGDGYAKVGEADKDGTKEPAAAAADRKSVDPDSPLKADDKPLFEHSGGSDDDDDLVE